MRQMISGLVAAVAVMTASAVPAMACGGGLFQSSCSPCGQAYVEPCAQSYVAAPVYSGCNTGCGAAYERLSDADQQYYPEQQYYYANQGPTYSGPGNFAPYPTYQEGGYYHRPYRYGYAPRHNYRYGYAPRRSYAPRYGYAPRYSQQSYGPRPNRYGYREHVLRRYY
jgi:hypothetical protein